MDNNQKALWHDDVTNFLSKHAPDVAPEIITALITANTVRWERPLVDGRKLMLLRLGHTASDREETFLGSVSFNDWLNKSLPLAVTQANLGVIQPITNDLDAAYFLLVTTANLSELAQAHQYYLLEMMPDLFFADSDPASGIHGYFSTMFTFLKSDFEPFPVHALPLFLARQLEKKVRVILDDLIEKPYLQDDKKGKKRPTTDFRTLQATMAFFYGRNGGHTQSHPMFITRLVTDYKVLTLNEVQEAFKLSPQDKSIMDEPGELKKLIKGVIDNGSFDEEKVRHLLRKMYEIFVRSIDNEVEDYLNYTESWLVPFLRDNGKFIDISPEDYLASLLHRVTLGEITLGVGVTGGERCRLCGDQAAVVDEKNILLGVSVGKFHNRTANNPQNHSQRLCPRCALYSYLTTKQLGSTSVRKFPVPKLGNIIFHYGQYTQDEIKALERRINDLIKAIKERNIIRYEYLSSPKEEIRQQWNLQKEKEVIETKLMELMQQGDGTPEELNRLVQQQMVLFEAMKNAGAVEETLSNAGLVHVLDLGVGQWRLVAFALEQLKDEKEVAQKRFARGRLEVYSLLSFLQRLSEETPEMSGPYYFQSIPQLSGDQSISHRDTFYIRDQAIKASHYRRMYNTISIFAKGVTRRRRRSYLQDILKLAATMEKSPLETFSAVLRDSPFRLKDDLREGEYQVFKSPHQENLGRNRALGVYDGWPYLAAYYALKELTVSDD